MQYKEFRELHLSRLMLGAVQFGLNYGIANQGGKPEYRQVLEILSASYEGGVNCFDTAAMYGDSEEVLGRAFTELGIRDKVTLVSKIRHATSAGISHKDRYGFVEKSVTDSLRNLKLECLPVCLIHDENDQWCLDALAECRERGLVRYIGVSAETNKGAEQIIRDSLTQAMQIPCNLLDHRFTSTGIYAAAAAKEMAVFSRSVYLQGLLLMPESAFPVSLHSVIPVHRSIQQLAEEHGMSMPEICMRYVLSRSEITCILVGVDTVRQMQENLALFEKGPLPGEMVKEIDQVVPDFPENVVRPCLWKRD